MAVLTPLRWVAVAAQAGWDFCTTSAGEVGLLPFRITLTRHCVFCQTDLQQCLEVRSSAYPDHDHMVLAEVPVPEQQSHWHPGPLA